MAGRPARSASGWASTPARPSRAAATTSARPSTGRRGSCRPVTAARSCCRTRPRRSSADAAARTAPRCATSVSIGSRTSAGRSASSSSPIRACRPSSRRSSTLDLRPNNLPTETSAFVGRDAELQAIRERLDDADVRLVTLTGPGGTGKTRLALRAAADQIDRFADGVFFVDLVTATDSDAVLAARSATARRPRRRRGALAARRAPPPAPCAAGPARPRQLRAGHRRRADARRAARRLPGPQAARDEPRGAPRPRRERRVGAAAVAPGGGRRTTSADELSQFEAIQLFVERARGVRSDFRLTDDNAAAVAEICRRLDGLPLAIELATARLNLFSPEALRDRLGEQPQGARQRRPRPARAPADAPRDDRVELPAPDARRAAAVRARCRSSPAASVEAVEAVAADLDDAAGTELDALDGLGSLVDKSLVRQLETADGDATPRVVMLETIKAYATARLDAQPDFADGGPREPRPLLRGPRAPMPPTDVGAPPSSTTSGSPGAIRSAGRTSRGSGTLRDALWPIYDARGWYHATIQLADDLLAVLASTPDAPRRWQTQLTLQTSRARAITLLRGYSAEAEDAYAEALALVKEHGEVPQLFPVLRNLASFHGYRGEFDKAIEYANEILRLADAQDDASMRVERLHVPRREHRVRRRPRGRARVPRPGDRRVRERRLPAAEAAPRARPAGVVPDDVGLLPVAPRLPGSRGRASRAGDRARDRHRPSVLARVRLLPLRVPAPLAPRAGDRRSRAAESALRGGRDERPADLASARDVPARRGDERPGPAARRASARWPTASTSTRACGRRRSSGR